MIFFIDILLDAPAIFPLRISEVKPGSLARAANSRKAESHSLPPRDQRMPKTHRKLFDLDPRPLGGQEVAQFVKEDHEAEPQHQGDDQ